MINIYASRKQPINETPYEVVERKGIGHPDSLCDGIAESISQAYSIYCLNKYGVVLRHMLDKIALRGGATRVKFGGGKMVKPISIFLNGRFTHTIGEKKIPYIEIAEVAIKSYLRSVLPRLDVINWVQIVNNVHFTQGPGVVYDKNGATKNEREFFFAAPTQKFVHYHNNGARSNDTSTCVAYAPLSHLEKIVIATENSLNSAEYKESRPYIGSDIKVMGQRTGKIIKLTVCIPFISTDTPDSHFYVKRLAMTRHDILEFLSKKFDGYRYNFELNTRDLPQKSDYYLTLTGSAAESGDEGIVGRGNRTNGVISFMRPMSMEAACGKNPVYHAGKLYSVISSLIAQDIFIKTGLENCVYLTSQIGRNLSNPLGIGIEVLQNPGAKQKDLIKEIIQKNLSSISHVTDRLVKGEIKLF